MYRVTSIILLLAVLLASSASAQPRDRLAVLDFWIEDDVITEGESSTLTARTRESVNAETGTKAPSRTEPVRGVIEGCLREPEPVVCEKSGKHYSGFVPSPPEVLGALSQEIVRRILRRHWNELKYCYEKELVKDTCLSGKVTISFQINSTGKVTSAFAAEDTLKSSAVESCMLDRVRKVIFPASDDGGVTEVTTSYDFQFTD